MSDNKFNEIEIAHDDKDAVRHIDHTPSNHSGTAIGDGGPDGAVKIGGLVITPHMTAEEKAAAIKLANEADPGPPLTSWRYFKFPSPSVGLSLTVLGFDGTVMSSVNSMEQFQSYFGLPGPLAGGTSLVFVSDIRHI
jgi:hypothetical protein